jgi:hypothetical protein
VTWIIVLGVVMVVGAVSTIKDWRRGVFFAIALGALQDPVRKLTPNAPAILVLSSLPIWAAMGLQVLRGGWRAFRQSFPDVAGAIRFFAFSLPLPVAITLGYGFSAWPLAALGLFGYLAPMAGIILGFVHARDLRDVERLLIFYCLVISISMIGGPLEYLGVAEGWPALGTGALGADWVRYGIGGGLKLISGFYRSPDVMGWHAAAVVMLAATVALHRGYKRAPWLLMAIAMAALCLFLCGRRKMIIMPIVWAAVVAGFYVRTGRFTRLVPLGLATSVIGLAVYYASGEIGIVEGYYGYAASSSFEGRARVISGAWGEVWETLAQSGVFGSGIGLATQGAQHLGLEQKRGWQESGPSRLMVELGVLGFVSAIYLGLSLARASMRRLGQTSMSPGLGVGLIAFGAANAAAFTVSHQVYGDVVILTLSSYAVGMGLSASGMHVAAEKRSPRPRSLADRWEPERVSV